MSKYGETTASVDIFAADSETIEVKKHGGWATIQMGDAAKIFLDDARVAARIKDAAAEVEAHLRKEDDAPEPVAE